MRFRVLTAFLACAAALTCAQFGCGGGASGPPLLEATVLAEGLGQVSLVGLASATAYFVEAFDSGASVRAVSLTGGAATEVDAGLTALKSLAVIGDDCLYADATEQALLRSNAESAPTVVTRSATGAIEWLACNGSEVYWSTPSGANLMKLELPATTGSGDDPPGPIAFPETVASSEGVTRVAASTSAAYFVDGDGARVNRVDSGGVTDLAADLGLIIDMDASGATFAAVGANGIYVGGAAYTLPDPAVAVAVTGGSVFYATDDSVYLYSATGSQRLLTGVGVTDIDATAATILVADNPSGRGRLLTKSYPPIG